MGTLKRLLSNLSLTQTHAYGRTCVAVALTCCCYKRMKRCKEKKQLIKVKEMTSAVFEFSGPCQLMNKIVPIPPEIETFKNSNKISKLVKRRMAFTPHD